MLPVIFNKLKCVQYFLFVGRSIPMECIYSSCQERIQISENSFFGFFGEQGEAQNFSTQNFVYFGWFRGQMSAKYNFIQ